LKSCRISIASAPRITFQPCTSRIRGGSLRPRRSRHRAGGRPRGLRRLGRKPPRTLGRYFPR
jgi:hypothetical protein